MTARIASHGPKIVVSSCVLGLLAVTACDRERKERPSVTETRGGEAPATERHEQAAPQQPVGAQPPAPTGEHRAEAEHPQKGGANLPPFEGELKVDVAGKAPESVAYAMKGDKVRIGLSAAPGQKDKGVDAIIDTDDKKAVVLLNDRKEYVEVDLAKLAAQAERRAKDVRVEKTGETDTVAGRSCEKWKIIDRDVQVHACVAKGAPYFDLDALERQGGFEAPNWVHSVVDAGYVPLRVTLTDPKGGKMAGARVSDMSSKVDESRFEVPKDYKKTEPSQLKGKKKPAP